MLSTSCKTGYHQAASKKGCQGKLITEYHQIFKCECRCHFLLGEILDNSQYALLARQTDTQDYISVVERVSQHKMIMVLHALMGITTEAGELMDQLKKHLIYGAEFDDINIMEEDGDLRWYLSLLEFACNYTADECQTKNIAKLKARFPNKFNEIDAMTRNLGLERAILEKTVKIRNSVTKHWNAKFGFWLYVPCGCVQFQDGWELCERHKAGGYTSLLADVVDREPPVEPRTAAGSLD